MQPSKMTTVRSNASVMRVAAEAGRMRCRSIALIGYPRPVAMRHKSRHAAASGRSPMACRAAASTEARNAKAGSRSKKPQWPQVQKYLTETAGLPSLSPKEVQGKMKQGWLLIDVRPAEFYADSHAEGSINVELFRKIGNKGSPFSLLKKALYQSQGTYPVEANPNFVEDVANAMAANKSGGGFFGIGGGSGAKGVIFCCAEGGNLTPTENLKSGVSARSLVAAYQLLSEGGVKNVAHLKGGLNSWFQAGLPGAGEFDWQFNYRTPSASTGQKEEVERRKAVGIIAQDWKPGMTTNPRPVDAKGNSVDAKSYALDPLGAWAMAGKAIEEAKRKKRSTDE